MGPTFSVALVKTPAPAKPEPLLVATTLSKLRAGISARWELMMVWFEAVSTIRTASFPLTSTLIRTNPNRRLFSKGISFGFEDCGKAGTWRAAISMMAIAHCEAALKENHL